MADDHTDPSERAPIDPESTFSLIERARAGDEQALERLFARHRGGPAELFGSVGHRVMVLVRSVLAGASSFVGSVNLEECARRLGGRRVSAQPPPNCLILR
jgi:hypothetical protein